MDGIIFIVVIGATIYAPSHYLQVVDNNYHSHTSSLYYWCTISIGLSLCLFALSIIEVAPSSWMLLIDNDTSTPPIPTNHNYLNGGMTAVEKVAREIVSETLNDDDMSSTNEIELNDKISEANKAYNFFFSKGKLPLTSAYILVLWSMSILVTVMLPSTIGTYIMRKSCYLISSSSISSSSTSSVLSPTARASDDQTNDKNKSYGTRASQRLFGKFNMLIMICSSILCKLWTIPLKFLSKAFFYNVKKNNSGSILPIVVDTENVNQHYGAKCKQLFTLIGQMMYRRHIVFIGTVGGSVVSYYLLSTIGPLILDTTIHYHSQSAFILTTVVSWLTAIGIIVSTIVNGFGSVSMPYSCLAGLCLESVCSDTIEKAEQERSKLLDSMETRLKEVGSKSLLDISTPSSNPFSGARKNNNPSVLKQTRSFSDLGDDITYRREQLMTEVHFLETLLDDVNEDIAEMKESQVMASHARTVVGRLRSYIGIVFSIILLIRLGNGFVFVWLESNFRKQQLTNDHNLQLQSKETSSSDEIDILTKSILFLLGHHLISPDNYETLTQFIALVLAAFLSYSQVKTFFRMYIAFHQRFKILFRTKCRSTYPNFNGFNHRGGRKVTSSVNSTETSVSQLCVVHLIAGLLSCYCIACIVLTKLMLPFRFRASLSMALGKNEGPEPDGNKSKDGLFHIRLYIINVLFITSAVISALVLGIVLAIKRQNTKRYIYSTTSTTPGGGMNHSPKSIGHVESV